MATIKLQVIAAMGLLALIVAATAKTPPGIAKNPSNATCKIKKYKQCYNLVHVCPKFCPENCTVHCASCKPICSASSLPPEVSPTPSSPPQPIKTTPKTSPPPPIKTTPKTSPPPPIKTTPKTSPPPPPITTTPFSPPPIIPTTSPPPSTQLSPPPPTTSPPTPTPSSPPPPRVVPTPTPLSSPPPPKATPTPSSPPPPTTQLSPPPITTTPTPSPSPPPPRVVAPFSPPPTIPSSSPPPPRLITPTPSPPPKVSPTPFSPPPTIPPPPRATPKPSPPDGNESAANSRARCRNRNFPHCYNSEHRCPASCPTGCEVDCVACKPVCKCDQPGAVCQDPRFIGGDGISFYFHGKKDKQFCLLSDPNLHINAHFIGKRSLSMTRDFTWVQSVGVLFGPNRLSLAALTTALWDDSVDRLEISLNGQTLSPGASGEISTGLSIARTALANQAVVEAQGFFRITARVVPITPEDSRVHNYGVDEEDCFAHLDLRFEFFSLTDRVSGVLGQTYRPDYQSRVNVAAKMPVLGGDREFRVSCIFASDCFVSRFRGLSGFVGAETETSLSEFQTSLSCSTVSSGLGVVCKN